MVLTDRNNDLSYFSLEISFVMTNKEVSLFRSALTYLLTPWGTVLLEKLTGPQLVKKFPAFYGTRKFITVLTIARHLSLS